MSYLCHLNFENVDCEGRLKINGTPFHKRMEQYRPTTVHVFDECKERI